MPWNFLILPLLGGYYFSAKCKLTKFQTQRLSNHRLIFDSFLKGILFLILSIILKTLFQPSFTFRFISSDSLNLQHLDILFFSFVIAVLSTHLINPFISKEKRIIKAIQIYGNDLEKNICCYLSARELVAITLKSNKVYIGWIKTLPPPFDFEYITMIPLLSGYRNKKQSLNITSSYEKIISNYENTDFEIKMELTIPKSELSSLSLFNLNLLDN